MKRQIFAVASTLFFLSLALFFAGCSGGGSGGGDSSVGAFGSVRTGSVAVLVADGPADEYDHIWVWITEVSLLPADDGDPVVIFESQTPQGYKLDLLAYKDEDFFLNVHDVPAKNYSKIRLRIRHIEPEGGTGPCTSFDVKLPSGKIDLNPRELIRIEDGDCLSIRLDIDANKSIGLHQAGNSDKCIFRPVVFVDIEQGPPCSRCPKILSGTIDGFIQEQDQTVGFRLNRDGLPPCEVFFAANIAIFDENGNPISASELKDKDPVKVRGKLDGQHRFKASVVVVGETQIIEGTVESSVDNDGRFSLVRLGQGSQTDVQIFDKTLLLFGCDIQVYDVDVVQPDMTVRVLGKYHNGIFNAVIIFLHQVSGEVFAFDQAGGLLTIDNGGAQYVVSLPTDVLFYLVGDGEVNPELLCLGKQVRIVVDPDNDTGHDFKAQQVEIQPDQFVGDIDAYGIDFDERMLTVTNEDNTTLNAFVPQPPDATILDLTLTEGFPTVSFNELQDGDTVKLIGLYSCSSNEDFTAQVVLILERGQTN